MKVELAGFNIDKNLIDKLPECTIATPETISAAYARISRDPRDVPELRADAREQVEKARRSNQAIVFGMSHHSVAEHAYFNFDILGISRLALEELEARRIGCAYTEKSQRYITLKGDFITPTEFSQQDKETFVKLVELQNNFYLHNLEKLIKYQYETNPTLAAKARTASQKGISDKMNRHKNTLEGWAKEDARYALSLATQAQLGLSFNARTLEHAIRTMRFSELAETRELSQKLFNVTKEVAPSLIILTDPGEFKKAFKTELQDDHFKYTRQNLKKMVESIIENTQGNFPDDHLPNNISKGNAILFRENNIDRSIAAALIHNNSLLSFEDSYKIASFKLNTEEDGRAFFKEALKYISRFDALPREFELTGDLKFELIVSASNFAQLKRHRLMTLLAQEYNPELGYTIPESIKAINLENELKEICNRSSELFYKFKTKYNRAAEYCLTNAHRRRVLVSVNPRELYHISRLREDEHAQWDIKNTARNMLHLAKQAAPLTFMLSGGKDEFEK
ncbi:MAG: FAD-dependent thymidylate synthase [Candidatus Cloacimonetes bacterium]|nr:FAD-dependent thymidylate synthase [Candidatus Cloacimonadota bacterium]